MALKIGEKAPSFMLFAEDATEIQLDELLENHLIIIFFPLAFSGVCTKQMCLVRDNMMEFEKRGFTVIGISVDSLYTLKQFKAQNELKFTLLSDFNKAVSRSFGVLYETFEYDMKGVAKRAVFVIDQLGVIRYVQVSDDPYLIPGIDEIIHCLDKIE